MKRRKICLIIISGIIFAAAAAVAAKAVFERAAGPDIVIDGKRVSKEEYLICMKSVEYDTKIQIKSDRSHVVL